MGNLMEIASVPIITALCYGACAIYTRLIKSEKWKSLTPVWAMLLGVVLGVLMYFLEPSLVPCNNVFAAIVIGGYSGSMATAVNQVGKQIDKVVVK